MSKKIANASYRFEHGLHFAFKQHCKKNGYIQVKVLERLIREYLESEERKNEQSNTSI